MAAATPGKQVNPRTLKECNWLCPSMLRSCTLSECRNFANLPGVAAQCGLHPRLKNVEASGLTAPNIDNFQAHRTFRALVLSGTRPITRSKYTTLPYKSVIKSGSKTGENPGAPDVLRPRCAPLTRGFFVRLKIIFALI